MDSELSGQTNPEFRQGGGLLLRELQRIEKQLSLTADLGELRKLRGTLGVIEKQLEEKFPDPTASDQAVDLWASLEKIKNSPNWTAVELAEAEEAEKKEKETQAESAQAAAPATEAEPRPEPRIQPAKEEMRPSRHSPPPRRHAEESEEELSPDSSTVKTNEPGPAGERAEPKQKRPKPVIRFGAFAQALGRAGMGHGGRPEQVRGTKQPASADPARILNESKPVSIPSDLGAAVNRDHPPKGSETTPGPKLDPDRQTYIGAGIIKPGTPEERPGKLQQTSRSESKRTEQLRPEQSKDKADVIRASAAYKFLEEEYTRGVSFAQMSAVLDEQKRPNFIPPEIRRQEYETAFQQFRADVAAGRNPRERLIATMVINLVKSFDELKPKDTANADEEFRELMRGLAWNFGYEAKLDPRTGRPGAGEQAMDSDVKVSLRLLQVAGIAAAEEAKPKSYGQPEPGTFSLDVGGKPGAFISHEGQYYQAFDQEVAPPQGTENHPRERKFPTSSARNLYELLKSVGFFAELDPKQKASMDMMVQYTVDEDNASFPESQQGKLVDFRNSHQTLMGLGRFMSAADLQDYFRRYGSERNYKQSYRQTAVERLFTKEDLRRYNLDSNSKFTWSSAAEGGKPRKSKITTQEFILTGIEQARKELDKPREQLLREGRIVETRFGTNIIDIVTKPQDKLILGYNAVKAYGFDGYVSYNLKRHNVLINTFDPRVDLSRSKEIMALLEKNSGAVLRGNIVIIKGENITLKEVLQAITRPNYRPKGRVKEALDLEAKGQLVYEAAGGQAPVATPATESSKGRELRVESKAAAAVSSEKTEEEKLREQIRQDWEKWFRDYLKSTADYSSQEIEQALKLHGPKEIGRILRKIKELNKDG